MEFVGFGLAVVAVVVAAVLFAQSRSASKAAAARQAELEGKLSAESERASAADSAAKDASEQVIRLEADLADALDRRDQKAITSALWNLELERSYRQWADVIAPTNPQRSEATASVGEQLSFAIAQEVERLREEVGVSIRFDGGFDLGMEPESALTTLRITEELLALTAKLFDEVIISLDQIDGDPTELSIVFECLGWDEDSGPPSGASDELQTTVNRLDGSLHWEVLTSDSMKGTLRLPAPLADTDDAESADEPISAP